MRLPLIMYPNGSFARSDTIPKGGIIVEEPEDDTEVQEIIDQTKAVNDSNKTAVKSKG